MFPKICGLIFRLIILAVIGIVVFWFYLTKRPGTEVFRASVEEQVASGLNARNVEISNISRAKGGLFSGEMLLSTLVLEETEKSFFEDWHVKEEDVSVVGRKSVVDRKKTATFYGVNISPLGIGDNFISGWSAKLIKVLKMELKLKTGAGSDSESLAIYESLFKKYDSLNISAIQIYDGTIHWGHTETNSGSIKGARLDIIKREDSWEINLSGGMFSHGWLKNAVINDMKIICKRSGEVLIKASSLGMGNGYMDINASIKVQAQPDVSGEYSFNNLKVTDLIGPSYAEWLDGSIKGTGSITGNLNTAAGLKFKTTVNLAVNNNSKDTTTENPKPGSDSDDSVIIIRGDNFQLFKLMQMKDPRNSYSLLRAHKGTVVVENQGLDTQVTLDDVRCGLNDLIFMKGKFDYAVRTLEEEEEKIDIKRLEKREVEKYQNVDSSNSSESPKTVRAFSGDIKFGLIPKVFENNIKVLDVYPVDNATLRVWFDISLRGQLEELTEELADKLYDIMKEENN